MIEVDTSACLKGISILHRDQFPFAMAKTLSNLATSGQIAMRQKTRKDFKLHTEFIPNQIGITPARKVDVAAGRGFAEVKTSVRIPWMTDHETGDDRLPKRTALAVPSILAQRIPDFKTGTGKVRGKYQPKALLKKWNDKSKAPKGEPSAYIADGTLFARLKNKWMTGGKKTVPVFNFAHKAKIKPVWHFGVTVAAVVAANVSRVFKRNFEAALAGRK